ncbi:MAG: class I SAM-dependent methyltransferase [Pyrinomonadaceae bacterium]|nr:class I SAM-dependent methyltransferase [Pyrinomonadaceae bacterium]
MDRYYPDEYGAYVEINANEVNQYSSNERVFSGLRDGIRNSVLSSLNYYEGELKPWQKVLRPIFTKLFLNHATYGYGDLFPSFVLGGKALEVGCGNGNYLRYLKRHGWEVNGVDLSPHAVTAAKKNFDIEVFNGQLEECSFPDESFDYVHLSHVLEHFFDPLESMRKIYRLLKKDGIVFIDVPNADGTGAKLSANYWYGWDAPRHLFTFTPRTLSLLVNEAGFKISKLRTDVWNSFDWAEVFKQEELHDKKLENRPPEFKGAKLKIFAQGMLSLAIHKFKPESGDFIRCWVTKGFLP